MDVSPETVVVIGGLASVLCQVVKRALPGNADTKGVEINIATSLVACSLWMLQYAPQMLVVAPFDAAVIWGGVVTASTGGYTLMRMKTDTSRGTDR